MNALLLLFSPLLLLIIIDLAHAAAASSPQSWKQWSCDELTPNLCELHVESGSVTIQSIPVKYWRYTRKKSDDAVPQPQHQEDSISHSIVALHGGPGYPHSYLLPLKQLACRGDTAEVIFYDQAGCGESVIPPNDEGASSSSSMNNVKDHYPHLLDPKYYSEIELPTLIDHWKLHHYHILGHSWGTILAQLFALNNNAQNNTIMEGLQSLVLSGPISDAKNYIAAQWDEKEGDNLASLPPFVQGRLHALEDEKAYDTPEYEAIDAVLSTFFTMRTAPAPDCDSISANGLNKEIYVGMQGASEFTIR
jgi:proline-specific peptidase